MEKLRITTSAEKRGIPEELLIAPAGNKRMDNNHIRGMEQKGKKETERHQEPEVNGGKTGKSHFGLQVSHACKTAEKTHVSHRDALRNSLRIELHVVGLGRRIRRVPRTRRRRQIGVII
jgi:hypothetical protein